MSSISMFLAELKRRRVVRVLIGYCAAGLVVIEAANNIFPAIDLPSSASRLVVVLVLLGLPVALGLAWAFDVTPDGVTRTLDEPEPAVAGAPRARRRVPALAVYAGAAVLFTVGGTAAWARFGRGGAPGAADLSVAVLPFVNMSGDSASEYFSDGVTEEILDAVANVPGLRVTARTSSFAFKGKSEDVAEIARQLRVTHLLEGSVQRAGDRVRITAQLIDARSGFHQWSHAYTLRVTDVFAAEDEISREIARQLQARLDPGVRLARGGTEDPEAHDLYLQGRRLIYARARNSEEGKANLLESITTFQRALAVDSTYALAWSGIAEAYTFLADDHWAPRDAYPQARQAALRALALDPKLSEAYSVLAEVHLWFDRDRPRGNRELRRALALNPDAPDPHMTLAMTYWSRRRFREAVAELTIAARLDPASGIPDGLLLIVRSQGGEGDHLLDSLGRVARAQPHDGRVRYRLLFVAMRSWHWTEAAAIYRQGAKDFPGWEERMSTDPEVPLTFARAGDTLEARRRLNSLLAYSRGHYVRPTQIAHVYAALGEDETALEWLERGDRERDSELEFVDLWDAWDHLRGNARFEELRRRAGLPPEPR